MMTHIRMLVATASLFLVIGAIDAARAEDDRVTLYTALLRGDTFNCNAVNISRKTLHIAFAVLDDKGQALQCTGAACPSPPLPPLPNPQPPVLVRPGEAATIGSIYLSSPGEGYCEVDVVGTDDRDDLRTVLNIGLTRNIPGTSTSIFVVRSVEAH